MKGLEDQALEDESGYEEDEVIHIHFYEPANTISVVLVKSLILSVSKYI